jgi:putative transposase
MIVYETKLEGDTDQYQKLDAAIRTGRFVRNSIIRAWQDDQIKSRNEAYAYCKVLADNPEFPWAKSLNSMARQAHAERAWSAIERFYKNCKANVKGKKMRDFGGNNSSQNSLGFPKFRKHQIRGSVEYKTSGWSLSADRKFITFTDGFKAGTFKLWGSRDLHFYQLNQIKRVRVVRRHDGYYTQFAIDYIRQEEKELTGKQVGIDVGLSHFLTDNFGNKVDNPRFLRRDEKKLKRLQRRLSRCQKKSKNRVKARNKLGRAHLQVSRRRNDWVCKLARRVILSHDLVAIEDLKIRNMVKNHHLAKSINDAAWYRFREWLEYFSVVFGVPVIAVEPKMTSQKCSNCGFIVTKTLSTRTHRCHHCLYCVDRDENSGINILQSALKQLATTMGRIESNVSGENDHCLDVATQSSKPTRGKRKSNQ